jgi:hypothetical protein
MAAVIATFDSESGSGVGAGETSGALAVLGARRRIGDFHRESQRQTATLQID